MFPAFIFGVYFHCMLHVCCDENASGHHHYNEMQFSDGEHIRAIYTGENKTRLM